MAKKVFITGATGYIGGEALYQLLNCSTKYEVTALVRTQPKADKLKAATGNRIQTVIGQLDDLDLIRDQVGASDIIINTANVDHVPSAEVLYKALAAKKQPTILIHTSGTSVLGDGLSALKGPSTKVWSDRKDIDEINLIRDDAPHRPVDRLILAIQDQNPQVKTAIICPPLIYGISHGYDKINSVQIPELIKASIQNDASFTVYSGDYIWSHIHIHDLGLLYKLVLDKLVAGESIPQGRNGYYFGSHTLENEPKATTEPTAIEHSWKSLAEKVGQVLKLRNLISSEKVTPLEPPAVLKLKENDEFAPMYWGTNSRSRGDNGKDIGWIPARVSTADFWGAVEEDLDHLVKIGQVKA